MLGTYLGIRDGSRLIAMAGERIRAPGYVELSGISTHPQARRRGHRSSRACRGGSDAIFEKNVNHSMSCVHVSGNMFMLDMS
jgi:predicted GNAT family acetyltransferase